MRGLSFCPLRAVPAARILLSVSGRYRRQKANKTMTAIATIPAAALSHARSEGVAWAAEIVSECRRDAAAVADWLAAADRDPRGWFDNCAFDTVRDGVDAAIWAEWRSELSEECARACVAEVRRLAASL